MRRDSRRLRGKGQASRGLDGCDPPHVASLVSVQRDDEDTRAGVALKCAWMRVVINSLCPNGALCQYRRQLVMGVATKFLNSMIPAQVRSRASGMGDVGSETTWQSDAGQRSVPPGPDGRGWMRLSVSLAALSRMEVSGLSVVRGETRARRALVQGSPQSRDSLGATFPVEECQRVVQGVAYR